LWFRRPGWLDDWCVAVIMSPGGEQWLLFET
jgi:mediator of RNA polymerase II transcription subunit 14